jgi:hypothetical protein
MFIVFMTATGELFASGHMKVLHTMMHWETGRIDVPSFYILVTIKLATLSQGDLFK